MEGGSDRVDFGALVNLAEQVGERLRERNETVAVAESSAGGLISAALLGIAGASAYFLGGAVVYTRAAKMGLLNLTDADLAQPRASTEGHALILARAARTVHGASWAIGETGAAGPTGNRYGDAAGHVCLAVVGADERSRTIETGHGNRLTNMEAFASDALELLLEALDAPR